MLEYGLEENRLGSIARIRKEVLDRVLRLPQRLLVPGQLVLLRLAQPRPLLGPRFQVALVLSVAGPGEPLRVFSTDEFKPPPNPEDWKYNTLPKKDR